METSQTLIWLGINFGFAAIVAALLLAMYQKLVNRLADLIEKNTAVMEQLKGVIAALCEEVRRDRR